MRSEYVSPQDWPDRARALKAEGWSFRDLCGLDRSGLSPGFDPATANPESPPPPTQLADTRFVVVVQLLDTERKERLMLRVLTEGDPPTVPSIVGVWGGANFFEREAYDMFGIVFEGHRALERLLMPEEWEGHPLRKDYGVGKVPIEYVPQPFLQIDAPGQTPVAADAGKDLYSFGQSGEPERELGGAPGQGGVKGARE